VTCGDAAKTATQNTSCEGRKTFKAYNCDSNVSRYEAFYNIILKWNTKLDRTSKKMKVYENSLYHLHTGGFISCTDRSV
jgi:hypothetical protein